MILLKVIKVENVWFVTIGFLNNGFKFQDYVCNGCHNLAMLNVNISDITIITVKNVDYVVLCITLAILKKLIY